MSCQVETKKILCPNCYLTPRLSYEKDQNGKSTMIYKCPGKYHFDRQFRLEDLYIDEKNQDKNDYLCTEEGHQSKYISFCKKCNKNLCIECEGHEDHKNLIEEFRTLKPKKLEYQKYQKNLEEMKIVKERIGILNQKYGKLSVVIDELKNTADYIKNNLSEFYKKINNEYLYFEKIIKSYDKKRYNYNSILNIKNFNYEREEFPNYYIEKEIGKRIQKFDTKYKELKNLLEQNFFENEKNLIDNYQNFKFSQAITEIINYQIKEIKKNLGENEDIKKEKIDGNYIFKSTKNNKTVGNIYYDKIWQKLDIYIPYNLENIDLLFIIPNYLKMQEFGKLVNLLASILDKNISINIPNKSWEFIRDEQNNREKKIYWKEKIDTKNTNLEGFIKISLSQISSNEWNTEINNNSQLNQK